MKDRIKFPGFVSFISSPAGRLLRIAVGVTLIVIGFNAVTTAGKMVGVLGLLPLMAGGLDVCILGPLLGGYFSGAKMRKALHEQEGKTQLGASSESFSRA